MNGYQTIRTLCFLIPLMMAAIVIPVTPQEQMPFQLCGELPHGTGPAAGERGIVDRFNNVWHPSKALIQAQQNRHALQADDCGGFRIDFEDVIKGTGVGFDDRTPIEHAVLGSTTLGAVRQRTLCEVFGYISSVLDMQGSPDIIVRASQTDGSGFLAAASPFFTNVSPGNFVGGSMFDHITTGIDPTPAPGNYDAMIIFDFGPWIINGMELPINNDWNAPAEGKLDLFSIALHEATHTLGFLSLIAPGGGSGLGGAFSRFDRGIYSAAGSPLVDPATAAFIGSPSDIISNTLVYHGRNCDLGSPVYCPNPYRPGSSMSHFDSYRSATRYVMRPATGGGEDRTYTEEEMQALCDIGYALRNGACSSCAPRGITDTASTLSGVEICVDVLANDIDPGGGVLAIVNGSVQLIAGDGNVVVRNGMACFTPPSDFTGLATIIYVPTNGTRTGEQTRLYVQVTRDRSNDHGLDSGLVAWWPFNDSTAHDASGNGNHGTMLGGPQGTQGVCGAAMRFDGNDDYIRVPNSPSLRSLKRMTLSYWLKYYCTGGVGNTIGNGSDDRPAQRGFYTYHGSSDLSHFLGLQPNGRGLRMPYDATVPLDSQQYVHVVFVVTDDTLKLYRNGCLVGTTSREDWPISRDWDWFIGWSGDYAGDGKFLEGMMDEIRIYDRVLTHDEILELYTMCGGQWGVSAEPAFIDFGTVDCPRTDSSITIHLHNPADRPVTVHGMTGTGSNFRLTDNPDVQLDSAGSGTLTVRFTPDGRGDFVDTLLLDAGECGGLVRVPLIGISTPCADTIPERGTDILLSKVAEDREFHPGDTAMYRMVIRNAGPRPDTAVTIKELLPPGMTILSYTLAGAPALFDMNRHGLVIPVLAVGDSVVLTLFTRIDAGSTGTLLNCIEFVHSQQGELDPLNSKACAPITVVAIPVERGTDLLLSKIAGEGEFYPGDTATYRMVIRNAGPRPDTAIVINELLPPGITILSYTLAGEPAMFDTQRHELTIPVLAVDDSVLLNIRVRIGAEAVGAPVNCIELAHSQQGELDPANSKACAPLTVLPCPRIVGNVEVLGESNAQPGSHIVRPIELTSYDSVPTQHLRMTLRFDSTFMRIDSRTDLIKMTKGTLLDGWIITRVKQNAGELVLDFRTGGKYAVRGPGRLLNPEFLLFLGEHTVGPIDVDVELLDRNCAGLMPQPAEMRLDSICGLSFRLMLVTATKYALHPATPNPFNPSTVINFSLGLDGPVRLEVFNSIGNHVETLVDNTLPAGAYSVTWDATAFPSGLYYCRLDAGHWVRTIQMLLVK